MTFNVTYRIYYQQGGGVTINNKNPPIGHFLLIIDINRADENKLLVFHCSYYFNLIDTFKKFITNSSFNF